MWDPVKRDKNHKDEPAYLVAGELIVGILNATQNFEDVTFLKRIKCIKTHI